MADEAKIKINGTEYDLPEDPTLGEQRAIKRAFGFVWANIGDLLSSGDPDAWAGFIYLALRRARPGDPDAVLMAEIDNMADSDIVAAVQAMNAANEAEETDADRPPAGGGGAS